MILRYVSIRAIDAIFVLLAVLNACFFFSESDILLYRIEQLTFITDAFSQVIKVPSHAARSRVTA